MTQVAEPKTQERPVAYTPHPGAQTEFHTRDEDFVLFGGSKFPGKTHALIFEATRQIDKPGYKALLIRRTFPRLQEMMDRAREFFPKMGAKWEGDAHRWRFPSGATIAFGHCDHEDSKYNYQGHEYAFIGFDQLEEFTESQVRFIMAQCRTADPDVKCYVRATANPGGIGHWWIKRRFIDGRKPGERYEEDFGEHAGKRLVRTSAYIPATIFDNPTGLAANPQYLAYLKSLPEQEKRAFLDGDWDAFNTGCIFDATGMKAQEKMLRDPLWIGLLRDAPTGPEFVLDEKGPLSIWKQPEDGSQYFISADVAKGVEGGDYSAAFVIDRSSWEVVAKWYGRIEPLEFGKALYGLGLYYKTAKIAVEVWPGPGSGTGAKLVELGYPKTRLYRRLQWDGEKHVENAEVGWVTDSRSRHDLISALQDAVSRKRILVRDLHALDEMRNFVRNEKGRFEARSGCHDDQVVALGIACFCMVHDPVAEMLGEDKQPRDVSIVSLVRLPGQKREASYGPRWRRRVA